MTKKQAIQLFGEHATDMARALDISAQAVGRWPDVLTERQAREVTGAAVRLGIISSIDDLRLDSDAQAA